MRLALLLLLVACGAGEAEKPDASEAVEAPAPSAGATKAPTWGATRPTQLKRYDVELRMEPDPPPMGELFQVVAVVTTPDGEPVEDAKVALDARMPQHGHGMETDPVDEPGECDAEGKCRHPGGIYRTSGFKFHMGGDWTVTVDVNGPRGIDSTSFVYTMGHP